MAGRRLILVGILLVILITIPFVKNYFFPQREKVIIADAQQPAFALVYIADKKGYFREEGLDVSYRKFALGKDALSDVLKGHAHLATVFETPLVHRIYEGKNIRIISSLHISNKNTGLLIRKKDGVESVQDLRGKVIGVNKGTNSDLFLQLLLSTEGIDKEDVTIKDIQINTLSQALKDGTIDAAAMFNPHLYVAQRALAIDEQRTVFSPIYTEFSTLTGTADYVEKNGETLKKLLHALRKAELYATDHKNEAIAITDNWLPMYDTKTITDTWDAATLTLKLNNKMLSVMEREADILHENRVYSAVIPNFRLSFDISHLKNVNPEAVTLY